MGKAIAICNQKGGVGKTTTCVNLSAALGILEKKVLVVDTDPQANASVSFGYSSKKTNNPALQFMNFISVIRNNIIKTKSPNVDLLPFIEDLNFFEPSETSKFKKAIQTISNSYDYVLIDCVPFFKRKNLEILESSDSVIIPVQCDYYALEGLHQFLKTVRFVQKNLNSKLYIEGFLLTMYDKRLNLSRKVEDYVRSYFDNLVFNTLIQRSSKITQAPSYGETILEYDISSKGAKAYLQLATEIIAKEPVAEQVHDFSILPEESECIFQNKTLANQNGLEAKHDSIFEKILHPNETIPNLNTSKFPKNFDALINLNKFYIEKIMGPCYKNHFGNIWIYRIKNSNIFKKRFLFLYFKNNIVTHFDTKWFIKL